MSDTLWSAVDQATTWLDNANGTSDHEMTCRILKVTEEAGEAAGAWIGALGHNPRKGVSHDREQVAAELADVAMSALVAIASLRVDARQALRDCVAKVTARM
jgi:NTP pyrophosphatase (non-canonical NTP hydrolase)